MKYCGRNGALQNGEANVFYFGNCDRQPSFQESLSTWQMSTVPFLVLIKESRGLEIQRGVACGEGWTSSEGIVLCIIQMKSSLKMIQEAWISHEGKMESHWMELIWSLTRLKSALSYSWL